MPKFPFCWFCWSNFDVQDSPRCERPMGIVESDHNASTALIAQGSTWVNENRINICESLLIITKSIHFWSGRWLVMKYGPLTATSNGNGPRRKVVSRQTWPRLPSLTTRKVLFQLGGIGKKWYIVICQTEGILFHQDKGRKHISSFCFKTLMHLSSDLTPSDFHLFFLW